MVAKAAATLDALSGGRFVLAVATGYQRGEYRALGVDFEERNQLFDEALDVVRGMWSTDEFAYEGLHFTATGQTANPKPGHIPMWVGGNSAPVAPAGGRLPATAGRRSRRPAALARTAKTPVLETVDDLVPDARPPVALRRRGGPRPQAEVDIVDVGRWAARRRAPTASTARQHLDVLGTLAERGRDLDEHQRPRRQPGPRARGAGAVRATGVIALAAPRLTAGASPPAARRPGPGRPGLRGRRRCSRRSRGGGTSPRRPRAAVDVQGLAGDVARQARGQEHRRAGDVVDVADPAQRHGQRQLGLVDGAAQLRGGPR